MNMRWTSALMATLFGVMILSTAGAAENSGSISITHTPVTWAVKGQPLTLKARVAGGVGGVENVTLYYALFRDAAPFRITMTSSGMDLYVGTIEAGLLTGLGTVSYYIEAQDKEGTIEETPWYDVTFKNPDAVAAPKTGATPAGVKGSSAARAEEESSAATVGIIAGGAAAIAIGAYLISDDSGGSSGGGGGDPGDKAGAYSGTSTRCLTIPPSSAVCETYDIDIIIDAAGTVFSDTLLEGRQLTGQLIGNNFRLEADTSDPSTNFTGNIVFSGTVVNDVAILGNISGSANADGAPGFYSGSFEASKQ